MELAHAEDERVAAKVQRILPYKAELTLRVDAAIANFWHGLGIPFNKLEHRPTLRMFQAVADAEVRALRKPPPRARVNNAQITHK